MDVRTTPLPMLRVQGPGQLRQLKATAAENSRPGCFAQQASRLLGSRKAASLSGKSSNDRRRGSDMR